MTEKDASGLPPFAYALLWHEYNSHTDTKLLLTKKYSEKTIVGKITNLTRNSLKMSFFPGHSESINTSKITTNNSQGIILVIISCQRVTLLSFSLVNFNVRSFHWREAMRNRSTACCQSQRIMCVTTWNSVAN